VDRQRYRGEIGVGIIRLQPISIWNLVTNCSFGSPFICHFRGAGRRNGKGNAGIARHALAMIPDFAFGP
jgi:hypothetical protein